MSLEHGARLQEVDSNSMTQCGCSDQGLYSTYPTITPETHDQDRAKDQEMALQSEYQSFGEKLNKEQ